MVYEIFDSFQLFLTESRTKSSFFTDVYFKFQKKQK